MVCLFLYLCLFSFPIFFSLAPSVAIALASADSQQNFVFVYVVLTLVADCLYCDAITELPSTKLHTLLLDHHSMKLTWYIDWPKKEVLFNVDEAFTDDTDWFAFGFSKRGQIEGSDVCYFVKSIYDESYNEAIVSICRVFNDVCMYRISF